MSSILDLLNSNMGKELINGASQQMGINKASSASALTAAIPLILGAMKNNASSSDGASGLLKALGNSSHSSGGMLDNLGSILGGNNIDDNVLTDGSNILGHVFEGQQNNAAGVISKSSGIDSNSAMNLLKLAAPFVMSYLGKETKSNNINDQGGISDLLGSLLGSGSGVQQEMASKLQDFDNNDFSIDDIAGQLMGGGKGGNIMGTLGKLFGS